MFKNYVRVALRHLRRQKGHTAINVAGLALGLACCLVIFQYVAFETSYDRFHAHARDLFRVTTGANKPGEALGTGAYTAHAMGPAIQERVPEVLRVARLHPEYGGAIVANAGQPDRVFEETEVFYADPAFLEMFTFPLAAGDAGRALRDPGTALVSETLARKYFGAANPIGQELSVHGATEQTYRVTGVFRDIPEASSLRFGLLLPMQDLLRTEGYQSAPSFWTWNNFLTYVQLRPGADPAVAQRKVEALWVEHVGETMLTPQGLTGHAVLQPLRDVHLSADVTGPDGVRMGSRRTVYFFTLVGLVTLLIALVNYVNLATARALDRAREVGVRKALGAERGQLVVQFLFESALTVAMAALLAVVLAAALSPLVNRMAETQLSAALWLDPGFWAAFGGTLVVGALLAGLYPAFVLSGFRPVAALKGKMGAGGGRRMRQGLVVLQFAASVVLIAGTAVVRNQLAYMRHLDLGLTLEQVLTVDTPRILPEGTTEEDAANRLATELRRLPVVREVGTSSKLPGQGFNWNGAAVRKAEDDPSAVIRGVVTYIDTSFASVYGLELLAGDRHTAFTPLPDSNEVPIALLASETSVKALGLASPQAAVGQMLDLGGYSAKIVGVFKDFRWGSAHEAQSNVFFGRSPGGRHVSMRVDAADLPGTIRDVQAIYGRLFPGNVFKYSFADEAFDRQYRDDQRFAALFTLFAGLAIAIACLGLFGLAAFMAQQRTKEIGVRKVLGASVGSLVGLLSRDFMVLVGVAIVVAVPVAVYLMRGWLDGFADRVALGPGVFVLAGAVALIVALVTVSVQAFRAAQTDPVKALRAE